MLDTTEDRRCNNQQLKKELTLFCCSLAAPLPLLLARRVVEEWCCCVMGLMASVAVMKYLEMPAVLAPPRPLLVVEGDEFDHLWMLAHCAERLWSCWHFWVCCNVLSFKLLFGYLLSDPKEFK